MASKSVGFSSNNIVVEVVNSSSTSDVASLERYASGSAEVSPSLIKQESDLFQQAVPAALQRQASHRDASRIPPPIVIEQETATAAPKERKVGPSDFDMNSVIGQGSYGKVIQVRYKPTGKLYAMKIMSKRLLNKKNHIEYIQAERDIMTKIDHPFLVSLKFAFQTETSVYLVMTYLPGGELFHHLSKEGLMLEDSARFYIAEVILGVKGLHNYGIIHRDLKPENVLLDAEGHVRLTDFGLAKMIDEADEQPLKTLCGTNEYIAPEMYMGKGYNEAVDWWAVGCLFYEMVTGETPFRAKSYKKLKEKILHEKPKLPKWVSSEAHSLIKGLLERNVEKRLGAGKSSMFTVRGVQALLNHSFFKTLDWNLLEQKKYPAPLKILLQNETDVGNFAEEFTAMSPTHKEAGTPRNDLFRRFSFVARESMTEESAFGRDRRNSLRQRKSTSDSTDLEKPQLAATSEVVGESDAKTGPQSPQLQPEKELPPGSSLSNGRETQIGLDILGKQTVETQDSSSDAKSPSPTQFMSKLDGQTETVNVSQAASEGIKPSSVPKTNSCKQQTYGHEARICRESNPTSKVRDGPTHPHPNKAAQQDTTNNLKSALNPNARTWTPSWGS